jgi:hypothetical protein
MYLGDTPDAFKSDNFQIYDSVDDTKGSMIARRDSGFGDTIWVSMERSSLDTHTGDVSLVAMGAFYTKWCEGGHI